jgi:AraC-like DNA-binding protein
MEHPVSEPTTDFQQLLDDLEQLSGYGIAFHSRFMPRISTHPGDGASADPLGKGRQRASEGHRHHRCAFCMLMKSTRAGNQACQACDPMAGHDLAGKAGHAVYRRCHAGLEEVLAPVFLEGKQVGTLFGGQARPATFTEAELKTLCEHWPQLSLDAKKTEQLLRERPVHDPVRFVALGRMLEALAEWASRHALAQLSERARTNARRTPVDLAMAFMAENLDKPITLDRVAKEVHLSASRLSHLFTELESGSFRERLIEMRMEKARDLLAHTSWPVNEIALRVGYADSSFFCRIFARRFKLSPGKYRAAMLKHVTA